jgi:uncharacterized Zn finger protein
MSFYGWKPYVSAAERRRKAEKAAARARKAGGNLSPVAASRGAIAKTFWGKAWCDNLERYSDYDNRLPRGRTYVRNGSVIDLKITEGGVQAQVLGSSLYRVAVNVVAVPRKQWQSIGADCAGSIDSMVELLQGRLSKAVMERICKPNVGLFPTPKEIEFDCSCPDWASMCKHVAAVLYGVGARLDEQPELIFALRGVDAKDLVAQAGAGLPKSKQRPSAGKVLDGVLLADVFGIEMVDIAEATIVAPIRNNARATKAATAPAKLDSTTAPKVPTIRKPEAPKKTISTKRPATAKVQAKSPVSSRKPTTGKTKTAGRIEPKVKAAPTGHFSARVAKDKTR